ncbi:MAG: mechanosensitive ion channel family protein [Verrucomicrobiales bacterium]|nr:mechanosensitive ion channel family protein [Verrucomicrobiales bacterium]
MKLLPPFFQQTNAADGAAGSAQPDSSAVTDKSGTIDADPATILEKIDNMIDGFLKLLPNIAIAAIAFVIIFLIGKFIRKLVVKGFESRSHDNIGVVLGRIVTWLSIFAGLVIASTIVIPGIEAGDLLASLGIGGVAIGFAFKDILQNLLAGILLLIREPFKIGDFIEVDGFTGVVESIETRSTIIRTTDGEQVVIPNGQIYTNPLKVKTAYELRRSEYDVGIGYADDIEVATGKILEAVKGVDGVKSDPAPEVLVVALADSTVNLRPRWWTDSRNSDVVHTKSDVVRAIKYKLDEAGIDMPYPTHVHLFHDQTEETDGDRTRQREGWPAGDNPPKPAREVPRPGGSN